MGLTVTFDDLDHLGDAPGAVGAASDVHDGIDRARHLPTDRGERPGGGRLHEERRDATERVERPVRVARRERSVVAGVHRLDRGEHLGATELADDEPVGSEPERGAHERRELDARQPVGRRRPRLEPHRVETLERELSRARRYDRPLALVMFDIDYFKQCNDTYGHRAGDFVLREISDVVRERARKVDVLARYGGEEFALILPEIELKGATQFAEKIRVMLADSKFMFEGRHIPVTISVGVAELTPEVATYDDLIKRADARLYKAKQTGRNRVVSID